MPDWRLLSIVLSACCGLAIVRRIAWPVGFLLGFMWTSYSAGVALDARLPAERDRQDVRLSGWVDDFPQVHADQLRFSVMIDAADVPELRGRRVRLTWYEPESAPAPGQIVDATARLRTPHGFVNPAGFDYERWLLLEQISATGYVRTMHSHDETRAGPAANLLMLRAYIRQEIASRLGATSAAALTAALAIGDRSGFSEAHWQVFRRTGTSHLVAISGLHVGIVAMVVLWLTRRLLLFSRSRLLDRANAIAAGAAMAAAIAYAALAGFSVSTQRAVIMLAVVLVLAGMLRRVSRLHSFALAAVLVTAIDPLATLGSGFWLSFGAVATLFIATAAKHVVPRSAMSVWSLETGRVQFAVAVAAIPTGAILFGEFSLAALPINLIAIPWFGFVLVPLVLLCVFFESLIATPQWAWDVLDWMAGNTMSLLDTVSRFQYASVVVPTPDFTGLFMAVCGVLLVLPITPMRTRVIGLCALAPIMWPRPEILPANVFRLLVLDVGHGLAAIVETRSFSLIYDTGARFASGFDIGREVLLPVLIGRSTPDMLIVSHADNDHSGGARSLRDAFPRMLVQTGPDFDLQGSRTCTAGQSWRRDGISFEVLHPAETFIPRGNDSSCVLRVAGPHGSLLLTGDIERAGEAALVASDDLQVDVVIAPHHGSETSSSSVFVEATVPSVVIFSTGYRNRWNFPRERVLARWCAAAAEVYVTGEQGAIEVLFDGAEPRVRALRRAAPRYWRPDARPRCGESTGVTL